MKNPSEPAGAKSFEPAEVVSAAEARFERWRRAASFVVAPLAFVALLLLPLPGLKPEAHRLAAVMAGHCATVGDSDLTG